MSCHRREPRAVAQELWEAGHAVPLCACGGPWKPATISFGQSLVAADLERALRAAARLRPLRRRRHVARRRSDQSDVPSRPPRRRGNGNPHRVGDAVR